MDEINLKQVTWRMPEDILKMLQEYRERTGTPYSWVVRNALREWFKKNKR